MNFVSYAYLMEYYHSCIQSKRNSVQTLWTQKVCHKLSNNKGPPHFIVTKTKHSRQGLF